MSQHGDLDEPVLLAVLSQELAVFDLVAYRQQDAHRVAEDFPGREVCWLTCEALSEHALAEARALLRSPTVRGERYGVVVGTTDGEGGWTSWNLGFSTPAPGPVPTLPDIGPHTNAGHMTIRPR